MIENKKNAKRTPWNKGLKTGPMSPEQRLRHSLARIGKGTGPRPQQWVTGTDPLRHRQYRAWHLLRVRCRFRNELWELTFPEFESLWTPETWAQRGLQADQLVVSRRDPGLPWRLDNLHVITCSSNQADHHAHKRRLDLPREYRFLGDETTLGYIPQYRIDEALERQRLAIQKRNNRRKK